MSAKRKRAAPPSPPPPPLVTELVMRDGTLVAWSDRVVALNGQAPRELRADQVYIGRALAMGGWRLAASPLANPFSVAEHGRDEALRRYYEHVAARPDLLALLPALRNKTLACWCHLLDKYGNRDTRRAGLCHGDVLVALGSQMGASDV